MRDFLVMFATIFVAELGDKTQLAMLLFSAEQKSPMARVFLASASALVLGALISVMLGSLAGRLLAQLPLKLIAGVLFIGIGGFTLMEYFRGS